MPPILTTDQSKVAFSIHLENRLLTLSKSVFQFIQKIPKDRINHEYADQFNRSSCSIGANYIEANESESRKDFIHRLKICRKEAKEAKYWLEIILHANPNLTQESMTIRTELYEMVKLFSSILNKLKTSD